MATAYPTGLDTYADVIPGETFNLMDGTNPQSTVMNNYRDAIQALEAYVGDSTSAVTTSITYQLNNIGTSQIQNGAVTAAKLGTISYDLINSYQFTGGSTSYSVTSTSGANAQTTVGSQSITTHGGKLLCFASQSGISTTGGIVRIFVNIGSDSYEIGHTNQSSETTIGGSCIFEGIAAGTYTFEYILSVDAGSNTGSIAAYCSNTTTLFEIMA